MILKKLKKRNNIWKKTISKDKRWKRKILKENCCPIRQQLATRKTKKAGQVDLARKLDANVRVKNFRGLFAAYRARVQGPYDQNAP